MGKNNKKKRAVEAEDGARWHHSLKSETKRSIWAIVFFLLAVVLTLAIVGKAGGLGENIDWVLVGLFGNAVFLVPLAFALVGISFIVAIEDHIMRTSLIGGGLFLISALGLIDVIFAERTAGYIGWLAAYAPKKLLDVWASGIIFGTFI